MSCLQCSRINSLQEKIDPSLIHEFKHSFLFLGEHQFYKGYCVLVTKEHWKELTDIPEKIQKEFWEELMVSHKLIQKVFSPHKMNLCSLGNVVPHLHWHFFPRYKDDPNLKNPPWLQMEFFDSAKPTPELRTELVETLKRGMNLL